MSSMRKTVEGATKPKRAAPKAKYIDPIVQATFNQDGALQEITRTLGARMRDSNTTVVFKSLIVLHTMMRSGALDPVFSYLSSSSMALSLSSHEAANISAYGHYLAARIKAYGNLKRDVIRDKSDRRAANRLRNLGVEQGLLREVREIQRMIAALVEAKFYTDDVDDDVSMTALRLLVKDLLVLFQAVNEGIINILENYFALSKVDAQTALKIYKTFCRDTEKVVGYLGTAKKLYNVLNIPIPNLKHAPVSLAKSLEEYLTDPNFEQNRAEYKENKRIADGGPPRNSTPKPATSAPATSSSAPSASASTSAPASQPAAAAPKSFTDFFDSIEQQQTSMFNPNTGSPTLGFFQQQAAFNPFIAPQATGVPFAQPGMLPQMTGMPFGASAAPNPFLQPQMTGFVQPQPTGFMQPQMTGMAGANPFRQSMMPTGGPNPFMANGMQGMTTFSAPPPVPAMQPQATGMPFGAAPSSPFGQPPQQLQQQPSGFIASQPTGNPFGGARPMSLMPQATGNPFQRPQSMMPFSASSSALSSAPGAPSLGAPAPSSSPFASGPPPASSAPSPAPLIAQKTGSRNPFAPAPGTVIPQAQPPQPKGPSMNDMAANAFAQRQQQQQQQANQLQPQQTGYGQIQPQQTGFDGAAPNGTAGQQQQQQQQAPPPKQDAFSAFLAEQNAKREAEKNGAAPLIAQKTGGLMASIATDLAFSRADTTSPAPAPFSSAFSSASTPSTSLPPFSSSTLSAPFSSLSPNTTSALSPSITGAGPSAFTSSPSALTPSAPFLSSQPTGFAGSNIKPFQPTSSFGSQLASEFGGSSSTPAPALSSQPTGFGAGGGSSFASSLLGGGSSSAAPGTGSAPSPAPLQPQSTGYNPLAGTKLPPLNSPLSAGLTPQRTGTTPAPLGGGTTSWTTFGGGQQGGGATGSLI
ncbi:hypothetical protein JCM6882_006154 [Rhodosporidiobolus microsporus]